MIFIYKAYKVMLHPNNKQKTRMFQYANACRFAYNWAIGQEKTAYDSGEKFISGYDLEHKFMLFKKQENNEWLTKANAEAMNKAILNAVTAYKRFFKGQSAYPKFKSRKKSRPSFYQPTKKIKINETHVSIQGIAGTIRRNRLKLNYIKLAEKNRIPLGVVYHDPKFTFDGLNWWFSVAVEEPDTIDISMSNGIGIDLGIKELAVISDGTVYENINKTNDKLKDTTKKLKRKQRKVSRKYQLNKDGTKFIKTQNIKKEEKYLLKLHHKLADIRLNNIHNITTELARTKPEFIVMEDLNVQGIMRNRHLSKAVAQQMWGEFYQQMKYKSQWNNIKFITADRWYPSSKTCSACGLIKSDLKLKDRTYQCECGNVIDRDLNAAINLRNYSKLI